MLLLLAALAHAASGDELGLDFGPPETLRGCIATMWVDVADDATFEWVWVYRWDARGLLWGVDGAPTSNLAARSRMRYFRDADDALLRRLTDSNADHIADEVLTYRTQAGHPVETVQASQAVHTRRWFTWEGDLLTGWAIDVDDDGSIEKVSALHYRGDLLAWAEDDGDDDHVPETVITYTTDGLGRRVLTQGDEGDDGFLEFEETQSWDADGRLVERTVERNMDDVLDSRSTVSWDCPAR